jgi:hypothetical protein
VPVKTRQPELPTRFTQDYNAALYRLNRLITELNQRRSGMAVHPAMLSYEMTMDNLVAEAIALSMAIANDLDARFPIRQVDAK